MTVGEGIVWIAVLLLALYGCASLIRRICLRFSRCPGMARLYRVAVPGNPAALEPLFRCLQAQAAWGEEPCCATLLLMPPVAAEEQLTVRSLLKENPAVTPVTAEELLHLIGAKTAD